MRKLVAAFILIMGLPMVSKAQAPTPPQNLRIVPGPSPKALPPGSTSEKKSTDSIDTQNEAFNICLRATQRFEQQERAKGNKKSAETSLSASCKKEQKPASYWLCMDRGANEGVDFNTADWHCAKQTEILK